MKKRRIFEFNKILMIVLIMSFSFFIAGIVGVGYASKSIDNSVYNIQSQVLENKDLPEEYSQAEYVVNAGLKSWLDTGISACLGDRLYISLRICSPSLSKKPFYGVNETNFKFYLTTDMGVIGDYSFGLIKSDNTTASKFILFYNYDSMNARYIDHKKIFTMEELSKNTFLNNGTKDTASFTYDETKTSISNYYLFASNNAGKCTITDAIFKIYEYKLYDKEGNLKQELTPVMQKSTKIAGFYDTVSNRFLKSQGEEEFYCSLNDHFFEKTDDVDVKKWSEEYKSFIEVNEINVHGDGTESFPYLVNDIYELTWVYQKGDNYHIKLNKDIICNDGEFNGKKYADGGDGFLYDWDIIHRPKMKLHGNNKKIKVFFSKEAGLSCEEVDNLTMDANVFSCESCITAFGQGDEQSRVRVKKATNVVTKGTVFSHGEGIFVYGGGTTAKNCVNYIDVTSKSGRPYQLSKNTSGVFLNATLKNCINYGDIYSAKDRSVGLGATVAINCKNFGDVTGETGASGFGATTADKCVNYGTIISTATSGYPSAAGISLTSGKKTDCFNYGKIETYVSGASSFGIGGGDENSSSNKNYGYVKSVGNAIGIYNTTNIRSCINYGRVEGSTALGIGSGRTITNCVNEGYVKGSNASGIGAVGYVWSGYVNFSINNCINRGKVEAINIAGGITSTPVQSDTGEHNVIVYACKNEGEVSANVAGGIIGQVYGGKGKIFNHSIIKCENTGNIKFKNSGGAAIGSIYTWNKLGFQKNTIKDFINTGNMSKICAHNGLSGSQGTSLDLLIFENYVLDCKVNGEDYKYAQGSDFSNFYWSWKSGKIGLKHFGANSFFQGEVNVEYLQKQGFEGDYDNKIQ